MQDDVFGEHRADTKNWLSNDIGHDRRRQQAGKQRARVLCNERRQNFILRRSRAHARRRALAQAPSSNARQPNDHDEDRLHDDGQLERLGTARSASAGRHAGTWPRRAESAETRRTAAWGSWPATLHLADGLRRPLQVFQQIIGAAQCVAITRNVNTPTDRNTTV